MTLLVQKRLVTLLVRKHTQRTRETENTPASKPSAATTATTTSVVATDTAVASPTTRAQLRLVSTLLVLLEVHPLTQSTQRTPTAMLLPLHQVPSARTRRQLAEEGHRPSTTATRSGTPTSKDPQLRRRLRRPQQQRLVPRRRVPRPRRTKEAGREQGGPQRKAGVFLGILEVLGLLRPPYGSQGTLEEEGRRRREPKGVDSSGGG